MPTINTILEEIKDVPLNRLEELHQYIKTLIPNKNRTGESVDGEADGIQLADWQVEMLQEGVKDIEEGRMISHEDFMKSYGR